MTPDWFLFWALDLGLDLAAALAMTPGQVMTLQNVKSIASGKAKQRIRLTYDEAMNLT